MGGHRVKKRAHYKFALLGVQIRWLRALEVRGTCCICDSVNIMGVIGLGYVDNKGATKWLTDLIICAQGVEVLVGSSLTLHSFWW